MNKLLRFKEWLTLEKSAKYLSLMFGEEVAIEDVLELGRDGHITLSACFVNHARGVKGKWFSLDELILYHQTTLDSGELKDSRVTELILGRLKNERKMFGDVEQYQFKTTGCRPISLTGVWDLLLLGGDRLDVQQNIQTLTHGPEPKLVCIDEIIVSDGLDKFYSLIDSVDEDTVGNYVPAFSLPEGTQIVVRTSNLIDLIQTVESRSSVKSTDLSLTKEKTYLNIIGAFLEITTGTFKDTTFKNESDLRDFMSEKFDDLRGLSSRTLGEKFSEAKKLLRQG